MEIITSSTPAETAGRKLSEVLLQYREQPILLMVSGGSAFSILDFVGSSLLGPHVTLTVLDERFSTDPTVNNFAQLEQTLFYASCVEHGTQFTSTKVSPGESIAQLRDRFDTALHTWKEQNPEGVVIATMGIGNDGHTAGIFSGEYGIDFSGNSWVVGYSVPKEVNQYTDRITVTFTFLRHHVDSVIGYAVGEEKKQYVNHLQNSSCPLDKIPACILRELVSTTVITN